MSTDQKNRIAADCWKRGSEVMVKEDWDYAISMFSKSVDLCPDNLLFRQSLRGVEHRKFKNSKSGARMSSMKLMPIKARLKKLRMSKDWAAIDKAAEEGLQINPWDAQLNADVGDAALNLGYMEVAKFAYQVAVECEPTNKAYNRAYAQVLEERREYKEARAAWERVFKLDPNDGEARSKMTQLDASTVIERGGYEDAQNTRDFKTGYDFDRGSTARPEIDGPGESMEADLQRMIRKEPTNKDHYIKLADLLRREKRLQESYNAYQKAFEITGGDANIREQMEDIELEMLRQNVDIAKDAARKAEDEGEARKAAGSLAKELVLREIEVYSSRVQRYPKNSLIKFELSKRFMRLTEWAKAIPLLQQASADTRIQGEVLASLGECFLNDKKKDLGRRQFEKALESLNPHEQPDLYKKCHYVLGRLAEEAGNLSVAENHYQEILGMDYEYRDVLQRMEKMQGGGDGGQS